MSEYEINTLAEKYNLRVTVLPSATLVYSKINSWIIERHESTFVLFHFNNPRRNFDRHVQMHFTDIAANYKTIFEYIRTHDFSVFQEKHLVGNIFKKINKDKVG